MHSKLFKNQGIVLKNQTDKISNLTIQGSSYKEENSIINHSAGPDLKSDKVCIQNFKGLKIPFARKTVKINPINRLRPVNEVQLKDLLNKTVHIITSNLNENQTVTINISRLITCTVKYSSGQIYVENIIITYGSRDKRNHKNRAILHIKSPEDLNQISLVCFRDDKCIGEFSGLSEFMSLEEVSHVLAIIFFNMLKFKDICDRSNDFKKIIMDFAEDVVMAVGNDYSETRSFSPGIYSTVVCKNGVISICIHEDDSDGQPGIANTRLSLDINMQAATASLYLCENDAVFLNCADIMEIFLSEEANSCLKVIKEHFYNFFMPKRKELYSLCDEIYNFIVNNVGNDNFISQSLSQSKKIEMSCYEQTIKIMVKETHTNKDNIDVCDSFSAVIPNPKESDEPTVSYSFGTDSKEYFLKGYKEMYENKFSTLVLGILKSCMYEQKMKQNEVTSSSPYKNDSIPEENFTGYSKNNLTKEQRIELTKDRISEFCEECGTVSAYDRDFALKDPESINSSITNTVSEKLVLNPSTPTKFIEKLDSGVDDDQTEFTLLEIKEMLKVLSNIICDTVGQSDKIQENFANETYLIDNNKVRIHCIHMDLIHNIETVLLISKTKEIINFICASQDGKSLFYSVINDNIINNSKACDAIYKMFNFTIRACTNYENRKTIGQGEQNKINDGETPEGDLKFNVDNNLSASKYICENK